MYQDKANILKHLAETGRRSLCPPDTVRINISTSSCGLAKGAGLLRDKLAARQGWTTPVQVASVGCLGACFAEPFIRVRLPNGRHYFFGKVDSKSLWHVIRLVEGEPPTSYLWLTAVEKEPGRLQGFSDLEITGDRSTSLARFLQPQVRSISNSWGFIDPQNIAEYVATGGYFTLREALQKFSPQELRQIIAASGLLDLKGEPHPRPSPATLAVGSTEELTALELALVENNPHHMLESLLIMGYALGVSEAVIFLPGGYPLAADLLEGAVAAARQYGLVGRDILGTGFSLEISVVQGPPDAAHEGVSPAFALKRLQPLAHLLGLLRRAGGAGKGSPPTRIFYLSGDLKTHGVLEGPAKADLPTLIQAVAAKPADSLKALEVDFPRGIFLPFGGQDTQPGRSSPWLFDEVTVLDRHRCIVERCLSAINAGAVKTCARHSPCQTGLSALKANLSLLTKGQGEAGILPDLEKLAMEMVRKAPCSSGCPPAELVLSALKHFRDEFTAHAYGYCPTLTCKDLIRFEILQGKCKGCRCCYLVCPTGAVMHRQGDKRFFVDDRLCIKCGSCAKTCPFGCIKPVSEAPAKENQ